MKTFLLVFIVSSSLFLSACSSGSLDSDSSIPLPSASEWDLGKLVSSSTGNININLSGSYRYLDSEKLVFSTGTIGDLISATPYTIVYFYPKDGTPNCTLQAIDFSLLQDDFRKLGYSIIGVSKDPVDSHKAFAERNELKIKLLEDGSGELMKQFDILGDMKEYGNGNELSDIIRSTFIIDKNGTPIYAFKDIVARWHAKRILELIQGKSAR
jgi:thioredoxin-dependent peroxiredoxin